MKTTIELPDDLAAAARRCAAESGTTLRSVIEEALRRELARRELPPEWQADASLTFGEGGLTPWHLDVLLEEQVVDPDIAEMYAARHIAPKRAVV